MKFFDRQVLIGKAFANCTRLRMLDLLGRHEWSASALRKQLGVSKATLSQNVLVLKSAGVIVRAEKARKSFTPRQCRRVKKVCHVIQHVLRVQIRNGQRLI